jgi:type I restriction enzyme S subunit
MTAKSKTIQKNQMALPDGWRWASLRSVTSMVRDGTHFSPKTTEGPFRYLTSKNIRTGFMELSTCGWISEEEHQRIYNACPVEYGDVLLTKDGASVGNVCRNTLHEPFSLLSSVAALRGTKAELDNGFLLQFLMSPLGQVGIKNEVAGQAITRITLNTIAKLRVILPPLDEQRAISQVLSEWDRAIELTTALLATKTRLKQGLLQDPLRGKRRSKRSKGTWRTYLIGDVLREVNRHVILQPDCLYRLVSVRRNSGGLFDREVRPGREIGYSKLMTIETGDFLIARRQVIHGAMTVVEEAFDGAFVSDAYATLVPKDSRKLHMPFLDVLSQTPEMYYSAFRCSYGVAIEKMVFHLDWFMKEQITIPESIEEQKRIAGLFVTLNDEIRQLNSKLDLLKQQKRGLMQQLLTGARRVPTVMLRRLNND